MHVWTTNWARALKIELSGVEQDSTNQEFVIGSITVRKCSTNYSRCPKCNLPTFVPPIFMDVRNQSVLYRVTVLVAMLFLPEYWVRLNKRNQSPTGFCVNPQPTRLYVNYPLPNFSYEKLAIFLEIKKQFRATLDVAWLKNL